MAVVIVYCKTESFSHLIEPFQSVFSQLFSACGAAYISCQIMKPLLFSTVLKNPSWLNGGDVARYILSIHESTDLGYIEGLQIDRTSVVLH